MTRAGVGRACTLRRTSIETRSVVWPKTVYNETYSRAIPEKLKRVIDIIGAAVLIVLSLPLFIILPILIRLDSPGPVFYRQQRIGKHGLIFTAWKFRTMVVDAEKKLDEILSNDPEQRRQFQVFHKLRNDPRVTRVGRVLRRHSVDELPQLWNVLRGEMSLVGPRAYLPHELDHMPEEARRVILSVRPGLTGLWQVSGRNEISFDTRVQLEEHYVRNWSIWLDIRILLKTIGAVLTGRGAY